MNNLNNNNTNYNQHEQASSLSHSFNRIFQPHKLKPPRNLPASDMNTLAMTTPNPTVLEIGAGKGKHALNYAQDNPTHTLIAIERTKNKFDAFYKKAMQLTQNKAGAHANNSAGLAQFANLYAVHADAIPFIVHHIPPSSMDKVFILYPNPEPHNPNQQWLNMPFFEFLLSRLTQRGRLIIASNIEVYIDHAEMQANQVWHLGCERRQIDKDSARTHFEIKYLARGERCWQLDLIKPDSYQTRFDNWQVAMR